MKKNFPYLCLALILLSFIAVKTNAQKKDTLLISRNTKGKVEFLRFNVLSHDHKEQGDTALFRSVLKMSPNYSYSKISESVDKLGITHKRFQQYYKGIKVDRAEFSLHGKNGNIEKTPYSI